MKKEQEKILYTDEKAATRVTVYGWRSSKGSFYPDSCGNAEHYARYDGCTHSTCECGNETEKPYNKCMSCRHKQRQENYNKLPFKEWDETTPVYSWVADKFFWGSDDIADYLEYNETEDDLMLVLCEPNYFPEFETESYIQDIMPEDVNEAPISKELAAKIKELNELIRIEKPVSWGEGKIRTSYNK